MVSSTYTYIYIYISWLKVFGKKTQPTKISTQNLVLVPLKIFHRRSSLVEFSRDVRMGSPFWCNCWTMKDSSQKKYDSLDIKHRGFKSKSQDPTSYRYSMIFLSLALLHVYIHNIIYLCLPCKIGDLIVQSRQYSDKLSINACRISGIKKWLPNHPCNFWVRRFANKFSWFVLDYPWKKPRFLEDNSLLKGNINGTVDGKNLEECFVHNLGVLKPSKSYAFTTAAWGCFLQPSLQPKKSIRATTSVLNL